MIDLEGHRFNKIRDRRVRVEPGFSRSDRGDIAYNGRVEQKFERLLFRFWSAGSWEEADEDLTAELGNALPEYSLDGSSTALVAADRRPLHSNAQKSAISALESQRTDHDRKTKSVDRASGAREGAPPNRK
ncbi:MAG: hypothetical protein WBQ34_14760 [Candidatus Acidiferrales bacterium]